MEAPTGTGFTRLGMLCTVFTRAKSTIRSSARTCAKPETEPCPISEEPMVRLMDSSVPMFNQALTCPPVEPSTSARRENSGRTNDIVNPPVAARKPWRPNFFLSIRGETIVVAMGVSPRP